ncbi:MAG: hypothetical protein OCU12_06305 [Methanophagales archaeon]|nr:hypothetical protein [Methanophagales archaeon]
MKIIGVNPCADNGLAYLVSAEAMAEIEHGRAAAKNPEWQEVYHHVCHSMGIDAQERRAFYIHVESEDRKRVFAGTIRPGGGGIINLGR